MRARASVRAEALPRVRRVFKERDSLLLKVMDCDCLAIPKGYDKDTTYSKNLISDVLKKNDLTRLICKLRNYSEPEEGLNEVYHCWPGA